MVKIHWIDSHGVDPSWEFWDEIKPLLPVDVFSIGYLIDSNKSYKTIAISITENQVLGRLTIPASCIKKITTLYVKGKLSGYGNHKNSLPGMQTKRERYI